MKLLQILITPEQRQNLMVFLNRSELKGSEVPVYMDIMEILAKAPIYDDTAKMDKKPEAPVPE